MMDFLKGTKVYSIFNGACPVCQQESMYRQKNPYRLTQTLKMWERCGNCGTRYKIEPSFFYGAMYVSYPVGLIFAGMAFVLSYFLVGLGLVDTYIVIVITMIVLLPVILRLSRNIWINFFMSFDRSMGKKKR